MIRKVELKASAGICEGWIAEPTGTGPWPPVLFCMDAVGPRPVLFEMAERLASSGYVVLLANLFYRQKTAPIVTGVNFPAKAEDLPKILEQIMPLVGSFDSAAALQDLSRFMDFMTQLPTVRPGSFGVFGYCMGGRLALLAAAQYPERIAAAASFHAGGLVSDQAGSPHRLLNKIKAAVYVAHADQDPHMSREQIAEFNQALETSNVRFNVDLFPGAHHHFTMKDLPAYNEPAAEEAWAKLLKLFNENLSAGRH